MHTGDDPACVAANRARLLACAGVQNVAWLEQVHGVSVVRAEDALLQQAEEAPLLRADASVADQPGVVCAVMVADCMPVLLCDAAGRAVGAAHAGWRGLAAGILERTAQQVAQLAGAPTSALHAWLGPSIGPTAFEVGAEVREAFVSEAPEGVPREATQRAFVARPGAGGKYLADLPALARLRLLRVGVTRVTGATCARSVIPGVFIRIAAIRPRAAWRR